ncbi:polysaccharide deacetylase family protein [Pseudomonas stutzeri]|nr:polysaccharide deacetylase family protein [Stutzerimonas stutzeri]
MNRTDAWPTRAILDWLERILAERFGQPLRLQPGAPGWVRLGLDGTPAAIDIVSDPATFTRADSDLPCRSWVASREGWHSALGKPLPAPGAAELPSPLIEPTDNGYRIRYDILGLTYWMLARQEEVGRRDLDVHRRFPARASHAFRHAYLERPVVDEWLHVLGQVIRRRWPHLQLTRHRFGIRVSHDVDRPSRYGFGSPAALLRTVAGDLFKRGQLASAWLAPRVRLDSRSRLHPADPDNTFDWLMDSAERHDLRAAFYFICGRTDARRDADYEPEHPAIRELLRRIHARGHEIGLHPSYATYRRPEAIVAEAERLRRVCAEEGITQDAWGGRMHYLRWENPTTPRAWELAGMSYDSTLGYADHAGFRCGTCFEYPAFDPVEGRALKLRIRPLIAMEVTVLEPQYMGLGHGEPALDKFTELRERCRALRGCFTLLWHNSMFDSPAERSLYRRIIDATASGHAQALRAAASADCVEAGGPARRETAP